MTFFVNTMKIFVGQNMLGV